MSHARMVAIKRSLFAGFVLLLAILLQGVTPFLHAHIGVSTVTGIHAPEARATDYSVIKRLSLEYLSETDEDSSVVTVGAERSNEDTKLAVNLARLSVSLTDVPAKPTVMRRIGIGLQTFAWQSLPLYDSEKHPPPALAPPTQTL